MATNTLSSPHTLLTILPEAEEEVAIFKVVLVHDVVDVVSGDKELAHLHRLLATGGLPHPNEAVHQVRG